MRVGIIVHSQTGNTLSVARRLQERIQSEGHTAELKQVVPEMEAGKAVPGKLAESPGAEGYDALVFAAPVWAFSLSTVMKTYLGQLPPLPGKRAGVFVTQSFKRPFLGGNRSVRQMRRFCAEKGAEVYATAVINWKSEERERQIGDLLDRFCKL